MTEVCSHKGCEHKRDVWLSHTLNLDADTEFVMNWIEQGKPIHWSSHVDIREEQRNIPAYHAKDALENGHCIHRVKYTDPTFGKVTKLLWLGYVRVAKGKYRPLHLVININRNGRNTTITIATIYDPSQRSYQWNQDFTRRICFEI